MNDECQKRNGSRGTAGTRGTRGTGLPGPKSQGSQRSQGSQPPRLRSPGARPLLAAAAAALALLAAPARADIVPGLEEFGELTLVDSIECAADTAHRWRDYPAGRSFVTNILGEACVAMRPVAASATSKGQESASYVAWRVGEGRGLVPGDPYVLVIDYPDDAPRSATVMNFGTWTHHGFATGFAVPDSMSPPYVAQVLESYAIPLSGEFRQFTEVMFPMEQCQQVESANKNGAALFDLPANGFDVVFALFPQADCTTWTTTSPPAPRSTTRSAARRAATSPSARKWATTTPCRGSAPPRSARTSPSRAS